jgi:hypothetical protein
VKALVFIDGNDLRAREIRQILPGVELSVAALQSGFSTSAPEPSQRARDKVLAHPVATGCFAEAVDLLTVDGKSLQLELDSENESRFCKWWRETPTKLVLVVALRRAAEAEIELFTAVCDGRIADRPAGPHSLGWDRLFVPGPQAGGGGDDDQGEGEDEGLTLAQRSEAGLVSEFRRRVYTALGDALVAAPQGAMVVEPVANR